jgi:murein DD-endopeptidase MepM/ murein hydrolase activator NlpD
VREGQPVRRGELLGLCGSSGRSPRPHLHFQLQAAPQLGAPTLPCRFQDVVSRSARGDRLGPSVCPGEGDTVRNLEPDEGLAEHLRLRPGEARAYRVGDAVEHVECRVDLLGRMVLCSVERGA